MQQFQRACPHCDGQGKKLHSTCHVCHGAKQVKNLDELTVFIEKGIPDGHEYVSIVIVLYTLYRNIVKQPMSMST
jgi:DnaJ-class molecular chaperone